MDDSRFRQACWHLCSDGTGLKNAGIGLSRYKQLPRTINLLSNDQLSLLAGLPGFLDMAARFLTPALRQSFPGSGEERKLLAGNISHYISNALATRLWDEFTTLGREGLVKLLMLSFSGVAIDMEDTFLIDGMGLSHASTASGIIWTMPVGDRVRLIIPPVVQHAAICHCQKKEPDEYSTWGEIFPGAHYSNARHQDKLRLMLIVPAQDFHQMFKGIPNPKASVAVKGQREAISIVPGSNEFITQPSGTVNVPDWMAMVFLVHKDAKHGGKAPAGDLRFVIDTMHRVRQLVIIQCKKHAGNDTARPAQIANAYDDLQECVERWNKAEPHCILQLVFVWVVFKMEQGPRAFARVYAGWGLSQPFYWEQEWCNLGFTSLEDFWIGFWEGLFISPKDPNNLLAMLWTWQNGHVGATPGFDGDHVKALASIKAKALVMPAERDLYFPAADDEFSKMPNAELRVIRGRFAGDGGLFLPAQINHLQMCQSANWPGTCEAIATTCKLWQVSLLQRLGYADVNTSTNAQGL
ncbi:hypothetical protein WJX82_009865 [Trebouxia sp. C0006]